MDDLDEEENPHSIAEWYCAIIAARRAIGDADFASSAKQNHPPNKPSPRGERQAFRRFLQRILDP